MTQKTGRGWRSEVEHKRYEDYKKDGYLEAGCPLCYEEPLQEFNYWKLMVNKFPYDSVTEIHHMLIPKRHTDGYDLSVEEQRELQNLKKTFLNENYNYIIESLPNKKSIPAHLHLHVVTLKEV